MENRPSEIELQLERLNSALEEMEISRSDWMSHLQKKRGTPKDDTGITPGGGDRAKPIPEGGDSPEADPTFHTSSTKKSGIVHRFFSSVQKIWQKMWGSNPTEE